MLYTDGQFSFLGDDLLGLAIQLNVCAKTEHVPEIERHIRVLKERTRCKFNALPFKKHPLRMVIENVNHSTFWLNALPPSQGIHPILSPREIITGQPIDY